MKVARNPLKTYHDAAAAFVKKAFSEQGLGEPPGAQEPPEGMGDIGFAFFDVAKRNRLNPAKLAADLAIAGKSSTDMDWTSAGPYLNAHLPRRDCSRIILESALALGPIGPDVSDGFGMMERKGETRVVEHTSANPNGPLHVGRSRNPIIGDTMARLLKAVGYDVETQFYVDDMGVQVATLAWGVVNLDPAALKAPDRARRDYELVRFYQEANARMDASDEVKAGVRDILKRHESGDEAAGRMVRESSLAVLEGMREGLMRLNVNVDRFVWESQFIRDGSVNKVLSRLNASPLTRSDDDGARYLELEGEGIDGRSTRFVYQRSDGTSLYATRDIAYHLWKVANYDGYLDILGEDHKLQARQVSIGLREAGSPPRPTDSVMFYSFVSLPEGKMSTRRDRVVYLDDLVDEAISLAMKEVDARRPELDPQARERIADAIGRGCVRYNIVKVQPEKNMTFKWDDALNFEGDSAPFIQYGNARCAGILGKAGEFKPTTDVEPEPQEWMLLKAIGATPAAVLLASEGSPHKLAKHASELVASFNQFYRDCPVLNAPPSRRDYRLSIVKASSNAIVGCLNLLGLPVLEEM